MPDLGSRGPWALQEEYEIDADTMAVILFNWTFTFDGMATRLNRVCPRSMSYQWEMAAVGRDFYSKLVRVEEFVYWHPHPHYLRRLLLHLERSRTKE